MIYPSNGGDANWTGCDGGISMATMKVVVDVEQ